MNELEQLIYDTPNNMQLGAKIREKYSHLKKQVFPVSKTENKKDLMSHNRYSHSSRR